MNIRRTMAQALVGFLKNQFTRRDGNQFRLIEGCAGIFGHGNVAGIGQALEQDTGLKYYLFRNEQAMVHAANAFAKTSFRMRTLACTTSIGPGATNMLTGAATATINRLPVLLLPGDIFARRNVAPVLQQLEFSGTQDISVNDCFKPVSRYWDRVQRPEQLLTSLPEAMRVLTSPSETGAVTLCLPQDVQTEAYDFPEEFFAQRIWEIPRNRCDKALLQRAAEWIRDARKPLIVAGGGVLYSEASEALSRFASATGVPVCETQAGKGSLPFDHGQQVGAIGTSGSLCANVAAREADLVIGIGTRYTDFTTASKTAFQNPAVRFINMNAAEFDSYKHIALPLTGDARTTLEELQACLGPYQVTEEYRAHLSVLKVDWEREVERIYDAPINRLMTQTQVIGIMCRLSEPTDIIVCAAGSLPGDLHKLWRTRQPGGYHIEYGYSCMGYEIAGGIGARLAAPHRDVFVLMGDGSYLMMAQEIVTAIQEGIKLNIIVLDNHGFASIGGLSRDCGNEGMGTNYRFRQGDGYDGEAIPVDYVANAASLGAWAIRAENADDLEAALIAARKQTHTAVIVIETSFEDRLLSYDSWWDVPIAEVSEQKKVIEARQQYEHNRNKERFYF